MALTDDQIFLLNLLNAGEDTGLILDAPGDGQTVGQVAQQMLDHLHDRGPDQAYDFKTYGDMETALTAILHDPTLSNMQIAAADKDGTGNLHYIVTTPEGQGPREAVVIFSGTTGYREWHDDFVAGGQTDTPDGVSSEVQVEMLAWYQKHQDILSQCDIVTTSGHSKGGNTAQYIALMDGSVDRCVSLDGEGFSDDFVAKYHDLIAMRQNKIVNYAADSDYVNILLNHVGETRYIKSKLSEDNFAWYHSPYTIMDRDNPGASLTGDGRRVPQNPGLHELDMLLNSYLRTLSDEKKAQVLDLLGNIVAGLLSGEDEKLSLDELIHLAAKSDNPELVGDLLSYILQYLNENPERAEIIESTLNQIVPGLGDLVDKIARVIDGGPGGFFVGWTIRQFIYTLASVLEPILALFGVGGEARDLLFGILKQALSSYGDHDINVTGDISVESGGGAEIIRVDVGLLERLARELQAVSADLETLSGQAYSAAGACQGSPNNLKMSIASELTLFTMSILSGDTPEAMMRGLGKCIIDYSNRANRLARALSQAAQACAETEEKTTRGFNAITIHV